jgi:SAM-dependent methyltransferase
MRPRLALAHLIIVLGRFLVLAGRFIDSLAIMIMRPDDLVEFGRRFYSSPEQVRHWCSGDLVEQGLSSLETALLERVPFQKGRLLLLNVGGGREAIPLARCGFEVTGVDFVAAMVQKAKENVAKHGQQLHGLVQEITELQVPPGAYHLAWLSNSSYSSIPTRKKRVETLKRINQALKPDGFFICTFHWEGRSRFLLKIEPLRKTIAFLTRGNLGYEPGDILWLKKEFLHGFDTEAEVISEFEAGGFRVLHLITRPSEDEAGALLAVK